MVYYYFLTVDKVKLNMSPTPRELRKCVFDVLLKCSGLKEIENINCFEYKEKGKKVGSWLHYHTLCSSDQGFYKYKDCKVDGYSIKLIRIKNHSEVMKVCNYINKGKIDEALDVKYSQEPTLEEKIEAGVYCFYDSDS